MCVYALACARVIALFGFIINLLKRKEIIFSCGSQNFIVPISFMYQKFIFVSQIHFCVEISLLWAQNFLVPLSFMYQKLIFVSQIHLCVKNSLLWVSEFSCTKSLCIKNSTFVSQIHFCVKISLLWVSEFSCVTLFYVSKIHFRVTNSFVCQKFSVVGLRIFLYQSLLCFKN